MSPDGKSVYVASSVQRRRGAPQPQHDHRGDHPARREPPAASARRGRGPAPTATGSTARLGGGQPGRKERLRRLATAATPWRASTATRPPGRSPSPPGPPAASARTGSGPCADGHGLDSPSRWRSAPTGRASTSPRSAATPWRASTATRPPGRSPSPPGPPAASARRGRGPAPTAMGSTARSRWRSAPTGRASTSPRATATPWRASTATRPPGRSPSPPGPPAASARRGGALRRRPWARRPVLGGGQPGRKERLRRLVASNAVARLNRNPTTGAITQPAGTAGCVSQTGAGPCADGHGLNGPHSVAVSADGKSVYVASVDQRRRGALNRAP